MLTLIGNLPAVPMLTSAAGNLAVSLLRALFFLLAKRLAAALDELAAVGSVLGHPLRLLALRRSRARGRRAAYGRLRRDLPPGRSLRRIAEFAAAALSKSGPADTAGSHHATDDPDEADFLLTDTGLVQRILTNPGVLLFLGLTVLSLVAERVAARLRAARRRRAGPGLGRRRRALARVPAGFPPGGRRLRATARRRTWP